MARGLLLLPQRRFDVLKAREIYLCLHILAFCEEMLPLIVLRSTNTSPRTLSWYYYRRLLLGLSPWSSGLHHHRVVASARVGFTESISRTSPLADYLVVHYPLT